MTIGLWVGGRCPAGDVAPYVVVQVVGAIAAAGVLYVIASGAPGFEARGFAANGFGEHSPGGYSMVACLIAEAVLTAGFLIVIMGATDTRAPAGFAPLAIGLALTLIHLISIPVTIRRSTRRAAPDRRSLSAAGPCISSGCSGWRRSSAALSAPASTAACSAASRRLIGLAPGGASGFARREHRTGTALESRRRQAQQGGQ